MQRFDAIVIGAGAAGLFCAGVAAQRGLSVLLIDHAEKLAEKIRISGGGRCNFTNRELDPSTPQRHFIGQNPHFCRSALARYTPADFIDLVRRHGIAHHEKHKGQLFCDRSAEDIIAMLVAECSGGASGGSVVRWQPCAVKAVRHGDAGYEVDTDNGLAQAPQLVVATGALSIPKIGATDFGFRLARQFGLRLVEPRPGLVPLTFDGTAWAPFAGLAGLALPVEVSTGSGKAKTAFLEDLLFTHRGLSGPAILQISSYWKEGTPLAVDLAPGVKLADALLHAKQTASRKKIANELTAWMPSRLADAWSAGDAVLERPLADIPDKSLNALAQRIGRWELNPNGSEGYRKAEVTVGGVDTRDLSSQTMEARQQAGLFFIGEVVDVTGWLGGYNFQWAWASGFACGQALQSADTGL
ncbi:NAD(P)/FAD-dependent oxidoreductase [Xylophilus sp. GOD-11R]|uniref:NAD(P)/FAD-dependent oxidoreductase n=1 Tax=Xylophilus sp. GOD-11R TaxID=3089814 RepID=UPI00298D2245|nr:NAD(P)/FAD-dependent oxidoreductase [Xylophilus sp. GOD-11R]WPB59055.1 NAD(P)/FAD-dependent oxidoreductase [Xylophilus sp. GOD-11R]